MESIKIGIIGIGIVGSAMMNSFIDKRYEINNNLFIYDKYKKIGTIEQIIETDFVFLALPTPHDENNKSYDLESIIETVEILSKNNYKGLVVIKSTMEPGTAEKLYDKYKLDIVHNPEFLTARTATHDFNNQTHIVLGRLKVYNQEKLNILIEFYKNNYPQAEISICHSTESESMKLFLNNFYAVKVQFFTELYLLCQKMNVEYDLVKELMLKNGWINPMHTTVPGPDGQLSYGGMCFPKDTNVLLQFMKKNDSPHNILESTINERNSMRNN
jgi:UDPglucose 6-dehydrogenase